MHSLGHQHGNLRPEYLLLPVSHSRLTAVKLLDNLVDRNGKFLNSQKFNVSHHNPLYLSPSFFDFAVNGLRLPSFASPSW